MTDQSPITLQLGSRIEAGEVLVATGDDGSVEVMMLALSSDSVDDDGSIFCDSNQRPFQLAAGTMSPVNC